MLIGESEYKIITRQLIPVGHFAGDCFVNFKTL